MFEPNRNLYGCWKMTAMRFLNSDGVWEDEKVVGGTSVITESGDITTFSRTSEIAFGYSGKFKVKGNQLVIDCEACSIPEWEGKTHIRTVKNLTSETLCLGMDDDATGRHYEIHFKLLTSTFGH